MRRLLMTVSLPYMTSGSSFGRGLLTLVLLALAELTAGCARASTPTATSSPFLNAYGGSASQVVASKVDDFGWTEDGEVFYSIVTDAGTKWYVFDPETGVTRETLPQRPEVPPEVYDRLTEGGTVEVLTTIVSPSGERILYERRPEGFVLPSFETPIPDYYPPSELWLAEEQGATRARMGGLCGSLDREATWLQDESVVLGSCSPHMGLSIMFYIADLNTRTLRGVRFSAATGEEDLLPFQADMSHDGQWLAFADYDMLGLWRVPFSSLSALIGGPLDQSYLVPFDDIFHSPQWSPDDRWIYYWHTPPYGPDADFYDQVLMRVDPETGSAEEVLSKQELLAQMGSEAYWTLGFSFGYRPDWRLSPDGSYSLVRITETSRTGAGLLILTLGE
jgi:Tol biopolymer transport system component